MEAIETERTQMVNQNRERLAWLDIYKKYHNVNEISRRRMADVFDNLSDEVKNHLSEVQNGKEE